MDGGTEKQNNNERHEDVLPRRHMVEQLPFARFLRLIFFTVDCVLSIMRVSANWKIIIIIVIN